MAILAKRCVCGKQEIKRLSNSARFCGGTAAVSHRYRYLIRSIALAMGLDVESVHIMVCWSCRSIPQCPQRIRASRLNAFAALKEIDHFMGKAPHYKGKFPEPQSRLKLRMPGYSTLFI